MAKKSFKGGLDNLLASAGIKKKADNKEESSQAVHNKKPLSEEEKEWLLIKIERLQAELKLWRTGNLSVEEFNSSLKKHGLKYNVNTNEFSDL